MDRHSAKFDNVRERKAAKAEAAAQKSAKGKKKASKKKEARNGD